MEQWDSECHYPPVEGDDSFDWSWEEPYPPDSLQRLEAIRLQEKAREPPEPSAEDKEIGFHRKELLSRIIHDSVDRYHRHVFLCYKTPDSWPSSFDQPDADSLPRRFFAAFNAKTKLTVCQGGDGSDGDVLIFPDMVRYRGVTDTDVVGFVRDVLVENKPRASGPKEDLNGSYVFICAHGSNDGRSGFCGKALMEEIGKMVTRNNLTDSIFPIACSDIGRPEFAGNLIIFSRNGQGKVDGHWYGYVMPHNLDEILIYHIGEGMVDRRSWRGQMGVLARSKEKVGDELVIRPWYWRGTDRGYGRKFTLEQWKWDDTPISAEDDYVGMVYE